MPETILLTQTTPPQTIPLYITEKEVMEITGISLQTLRNDRSGQRRIPYYKLQKSVRYLLSDIIAYMEDHRIEATGWTRGAK